MLPHIEPTEEAARSWLHTAREAFNHYGYIPYRIADALRRYGFSKTDLELQWTKEARTA